MKKFIYETQKFVYVDPENEEAMYDGYDPSNSTISDKDFEELINNRQTNKDWYSIQGGKSYIDYIFGKIEDEDKGNTITETLNTGMNIIFNKIGEIEIKEDEVPIERVEFKYNPPVKRPSSGTLRENCAEIVDRFRLACGEEGNIIEDNSFAGVLVSEIVEGMSQILLKRVSELPFSL